MSASSWTPVGPAGINGTSGFGGTGGDVSGRISGVAADPTNANVFYIAAAGGGVWKTADAGVSWNPLTDTQSCLFMGSIAVAPSNGSVIYAGEGEGNNSGDSYYGRGILKSTDAGATWTLLGNANFDRKTIPEVAISASNPDVVYAAVSSFGANGLNNGGTGIWKTTDGGVTWTNTTTSISTSEQYSDVVVDPTNDQIAYAAVGTPNGSSVNGVYKTSDGGTTWALAGNFPASALVGRINLAIAASNPNEVVASVVDAGRKNLRALEKTTDGGVTWTALTNTPDFMAIGQGWYDNTIAISPTNPNMIVGAGVVNYNAGGINGAVMTLDGGTTWTDITRDSNGIQPHTDYHATTFDAAGHLLIGTDGGIWRLDTATVPGFSWSNVNGNLQTIQFTGVAMDPTNADILYGASQDNGTEKFTDNLSWKQILGGDGGFVAVDPTNPQTVYTEFFGISLQRSDDGGNSFKDVTTGIGNDNANFYVPYTIDPSNSSHLLYGTDRIYTTTNRGDLWTAITTPFSSGWNSNSTINAIAIAPTDPNTIYASVSDGKIFVSTNGGSSWNTAGLTVQGEFSQILVDPRAANTAYTVRSQFNRGSNVGHVFKTNDSGQTWTDISGNLPDIPTWSIAIDTRGGMDQLFVGTDSGVYESTNGGSWAPYKSAMPNVQVISLELNTDLNIITAGTHGRGVFQIEAGHVLSITPSVLPSLTEGVALPNNTELAQFTDAAGIMPVGTYSATIDWGDSSIVQAGTISDLGGGVFSISGGHKYDLPGTYTLTINAVGTDSSTGQNIRTLTVAVASLTTAPNPFTIVEGQTYSGLVATFSTINTTAPADRFSASIDWGDGNVTNGTIVSTGNGTFEIDDSHEYLQFGSYTFTVTITDSLDGDTVFTGTATVTAAPINSTGKTLTATEGTSNNGVVAAITTGAPAAVASDFTATIDWGDGSPPTTTSNGAIVLDQGNHFDVKAAHTYARYGTYTIFVGIMSKGGATTSTTSTANVTDAPLTSTPISTSIVQGDTYNGIVANVLDSNVLGIASDLSATVNWGDGSPTEAGTVSTVQANSFGVNDSHQFIKAGTYTVLVNVTSSGGEVTSTQSTIEVTNAPVTATGTTITGPAGVSFTQSVATFVDAFAGALLSDFTATIDWNDSSPLDTTAVISQPGGVGTEFVVTGTHGYAFPGTYAPVITISENGVQVATATSQAIQTDSPLNVSGLVLQPITIDQSFDGDVATFTTANLLAPESFYIASIDWGDGSSGTGTVTQTVPGSFTVSTSTPHPFPSIANYTITVTVLGLSGVRGSATTTLEVNDAPVDATPNTSISGFAGQTFTAVLGTFTQYAAAPVSNFITTVSWGDGTNDTGTVEQLPDGSFSVSGSHAYRLNGVYPIHVDITSLGGSTGSIDTSATIQDVPLTVTGEVILALQNQPFTSVVATFTTPNLLATSDEFTATVDFGDGTPVQGVSFAGLPNPFMNVGIAGGSGSFQVFSTHTYANAPDNHELLVTVYHHSQPLLIFLTTSSFKRVGISDPTPDSNAVGFGAAIVLLPASGKLSPASDSGFSNTDGITKITQPVYVGVANPGAIIKLFVNPPGALPLAGGKFVGEARVDSSGHWSIQVNSPLSDGEYVIYAQMFDDVTGRLVETTSILSNTNNAFLIVDTTGPTVQNVVLNPATGVLEVAFHDGVGMNPNAVGSAANYTFSRINRSATQPLPPGGLQLSGSLPNLTANIAYGINGGRPRAARGTSSFVIDIHANAITDLAGNTLVEKTFVAFPQVSNSPNPDYIAQIDVNRGVASAPRPYVSLAEQTAAGTYSADVQRHKIVRVPHPRMAGFRRRPR